MPQTFLAIEPDRAQFPYQLRPLANRPPMEDSDVYSKFGGVRAYKHYSLDADDHWREERLLSTLTLSKG